jgi:hypothetical protein
LAAALAESALESGCEKRKASTLYTPSHLYDLDALYDPDFGSDDDFVNPHGDWLNSAPSTERRAGGAVPPSHDGIVACFCHGIDIICSTSRSAVVDCIVWIGACARCFCLGFTPPFAPLLRVVRCAVAYHAGSAYR